MKKMEKTNRKSRRYFAIIALLCILESLWVFVMYQTLTEPFEKTFIIANEHLKEQISHDVIWEDQTLILTGGDPYLILDCPQGIIEDIMIQGQDLKGIGQVVCYYDTGNGFTENHKVTVDVVHSNDLILNIRRFARTVRLDFESQGEAAIVQPDTILIKYADKNTGIFLAFHIALMMLFDLCLVMDLSKQKCSWSESAMKTIAFAILQYWVFKTYIIASGVIIALVLLIELLITVCILFINRGGNSYAKE